LILSTRDPLLLPPLLPPLLLVWANKTICSILVDCTVEFWISIPRYCVKPFLCGTKQFYEI
jgi:hypothetical protein